MFKKAVLIAMLVATYPVLAFAQAEAPPTSDTNKKFIGIDQDNGNVYYNGRNSGRYCVYRTVERFNRLTGYMENHRVRHCGHGLYVD